MARSSSRDRILRSLCFRWLWFWISHFFQSNSCSPQSRDFNNEGVLYEFPDLSLCGDGAVGDRVRSSCLCGFNVGFKVGFKINPKNILSNKGSADSLHSPGVCVLGEW